MTRFILYILEDIGLFLIFLCMAILLIKYGG